METAESAWMSADTRSSHAGMWRDGHLVWRGSRRAISHWAIGLRPRE